MKLGILPSFDRRTTLDPTSLALRAWPRRCDSIWAVESVVVAEEL
jgi:hypothetical protein